MSWATPHLPGPRFSQPLSAACTLSLVPETCFMWFKGGEAPDGLARTAVTRPISPRLPAVNPPPGARGPGGASAVDPYANSRGLNDHPGQHGRPFRLPTIFQTGAWGRGKKGPLLLTACLTSVSAILSVLIMEKTARPSLGGRKRLFFHLSGYVGSTRKPCPGWVPLLTAAAWPWIHPHPRGSRVELISLLQQDR